jgi:hypothetical protein
MRFSIITVAYWIIGAPVALGVLALTYYLGAREFGFCTDDFRFLSDQEKIDAAINYIIQPYRINHANIKKNTRISYVWGTNRERFVPGYRLYVSFQNVGDFRAYNPDCCYMVKSDEEKDSKPRSHSASWSYPNLIRLNFSDPTWSTSPAGQRRTEHIYIPVSNCGGATHGTDD